MTPAIAVRRLASAIKLPLAAAGTVLLFLFAVQLLGASTEAAAPWIRRLLLRLLRSDGSALGLGWLGAYAIANGSVIAALALSLYHSTLLSVPQLFLMVVGSRLGAAGIVVVIGAADHLQRSRLTLAESVSLGLLTFLLTLSVYLPVAVIGYLGLPLFPAVSVVVDAAAVGRGPFEPLLPIARGLVRALGPGRSLLLAVAALFGSLKLFDRVLSRIDQQTLRDRLLTRFERPWLSFALGLVVTGLTTSVTFSLGVLVPLYNRRYFERDELVPFVLGANIGTLIDTLAVALVLGTPAGIAVVLVVLGLASAVTLVALAAIDPYRRWIGAADDRLLADRTAFVGFVAALVVLPLVLLMLPTLVG